MMDCYLVHLLHKSTLLFIERTGCADELLGVLLINGSLILSPALV